MATATADLRARPTPYPLRALAWWVFQYRRTWRGSVVSSVLAPTLFLAAMGVGLGSLVGQGPARPGLDGVDYLHFIAPGLLAASAMQTAVGEATYPVMGAIKWNKQYVAQLATPLPVEAVVDGTLLWLALRTTVSSTAYALVVVAFGGFDSWLAVFAVPVAVLTAMAFAAPVAAFAATQENENGFAFLYRFGIVPLFLFSATFFPLAQLPAGLRPVAYLTPLWHGVDLARELSLGRVDVALALVHVAVLGGCTAAGAVAARRTFRRRLRA